jgi:hypothetical protein
MPQFSSFARRAECEAWVERRTCRPGFQGTDGCNSYGCSSDGSMMVRTLAECVILVHIEFAPRAYVVSERGIEAIEGLLPTFRGMAAKGRKILIRGHADASEEPRKGRARDLALVRANTVRKLFIDRGLDPEMIVASAVDLPMPSGVHARRVTFEIDFSTILPKDPPAPRP